jgi:acyl dehydratase
MMMPEPISLEQYRRLVGEQIGVSRWFLIDQVRIDRFAVVTDDQQFIHVNPDAAARTPFGGTIAHGFLSLSLLSAMAASALPTVIGTAMGMNYGFDKVRLLNPVRSGKRIRGAFVLKDFRERSSGQWQSTMAVTVEVELEDKPALVADWLTLSILPQPSVAVCGADGDEPYDNHR